MSESEDESSSGLDEYADVPLFPPPASAHTSASDDISNDVCTRGAKTHMGRLQLSSITRGLNDAHPAPALELPPSRSILISRNEDQAIADRRGRQHRSEERLLTDYASSAHDSSTCSQQRHAPELLAAVRNRAAMPSLVLGGVRGSPEAATLPQRSGLEPPTSTWGHGQSIAVSLLSYAFATSTSPSQSSEPGVGCSSPASIHAAIAQRISSQLGVAIQDVRLFEVKEINGNDCDGKEQQPDYRVAASVSTSGRGCRCL